MECIRFALNLKPFGKSSQSQYDAILKNNLGREKGLVELTLRSAKMHGRKFKVSRKWGDQPVVQDEQGDVLSHYKPTDLLPDIELYGQNEIYEMTRDTQSRNKLIKRFLEGDHDNLESTIGNLRDQLKKNRDAIISTLHQKGEIEADVERLPKLEDQARQFHELGLDEKLKIVPKLEKEKRLNKQTESEVSKIREAVDSLQNSLPDIVFLSDGSLEGLPHAETLKQQRTVLDQVAKIMTLAIQQVDEQVRQAKQSLEPLQKQLQEGISNEEKILESAFKKIPASQGKTGRQIGSEYQSLLQQIEQIRPKQSTLQTHQAEIDKLYKQRRKLLVELSELISNRSSAMQKSVKRLNRRLEQKVKLTLQNEGDRQPLHQFLIKCSLEGVGEKRLAWVAEGDFSQKT